MLSKSELRKWKRLKEDEEHEKLIKKANIENFQASSNLITKLGGADVLAMITSPVERKYVAPLARGFETGKMMLTDGEYVHVKSDTFPGNNRPDGKGFIVHCEKSEDGSITASTKIDGRVYHDIPLSHISVCNMNEVFRTHIGVVRRPESTKIAAANTNTSTNDDIFDDSAKEEIYGSKGLSADKTDVGASIQEEEEKRLASRRNEVKRCLCQRYSSKYATEEESS